MRESQLWLKLTGNLFEKLDKRVKVMKRLAREVNQHEKEAFMFQVMILLSREQTCASLSRHLLSLCFLRQG